MINRQNIKIIMQVRKTLKIPVHYDTTKTKLEKLERLTARITFVIRLISELITEHTQLDRKTIRKLVKTTISLEKPVYLMLFGISA